MNRLVISVFFVFFTIWVVPTILAENNSILEISPNLAVENITIETEEPICEEQLEVCIGEYNSLLESFREGVNCGTAFNLLKGMNKKLVEERDNYREEIEQLKVYKTGFYLLFPLLIIIALVIIFMSTKGKGKKKR